MRFQRIVLIPLTAFLIGVVGYLFVACNSGQSSPPTDQQIRDGVHYISLNRPDGSMMTCLVYETTGNYGSSYVTWFALNCDWRGDYAPGGGG